VNLPQLGSNAPQNFNEPSRRERISKVSGSVNFSNGIISQATSPNFASTNGGGSTGPLITEHDSSMHKFNADQQF
jgi:hypothetical protein